MSCPSLGDCWGFLLISSTAVLQPKKKSVPVPVPVHLHVHKNVKANILSKDNKTSEFINIKTLTVTSFIMQIQHAKDCTILSKENNAS